MLYKDFQGDRLSLLGFGMMRLPLTADGQVDEEQVFRMVDYAMANGVNYFDTAYPYHNGVSETVAGKALAGYPRESYYLADKYPGHQVAEEYHPEEIFERQLKKCNTGYFDFYMLHNVYEKSLEVYEDPKWGIIEYFKEQKRLGRIRHLGFSTHAQPETLRGFLERHAKDMEFCQIQLNYLDWTLQRAQEKVQILNEYKIPIWCMESVRGGKLCDLGEKNNERFKSFRPGESVASWGYRWLTDVKGVNMILSGMSDLEQMKDNIRTFTTGQMLSLAEKNLLAEVAEELKDSVPCTGCRYCTEGCPVGLDIPHLIRLYNDAKFDTSMNVSMQLDSLAEEKLPDQCIACGACTHICPQGIPVPDLLKELTQLREKMPSWAKMCEMRAKIDRENRAKEEQE